MNIALIGNGYWGANWARILENSDSLAGISNSPEETEAILQSDIDAVVIATPAETHAEIAYKALLSDKHVLCEKPFTLSPKTAEMCLRIATERNLVLMAGHLPNYHSQFIQLKKELPTIGKIKYIWSNRLNDGKIREEGVIWSFAPHDVSMIQSILGVPKIVSAFGNQNHCLAMMQFEDAAAHIFVSWDNPFKEQRLVVVGEHGKLEFDGTKPSHTEPLLAELAHFKQCIKNGTKPLTDGEEALNVTKTLYAINQSIKSN